MRDETRDLTEYLAQHPLVPYIRECDFAVRRPWTVERRRLLDYLLVYVQEGECRVEANGREHRFTTGDFCLVQPRTLVQLHGPTDTVTPFAHFDIFYNPRREESFPAPPGLLDLSSYEDLIQPRLSEFRGLQVPLRLRPANPSWFRETMLRVVGAWQNRDMLSQLEAQNGLAELVLSILKQGAGEMPAPAAPRSLDWITSFLLLHLDEAISVEEMARRARLSPSRFAAVFRRQFGMAPHQYLLHLRIGHAQQLLAHSDATLEHIARYCGFADVHHFAKSFKKSTGQTPGAYRRK